MSRIGIKPGRFLWRVFVVVAFSWSDRSHTRHDWAQVLELTDGKIIAIQDYAKPSRAALATRLRAALSF